MEISGSCWLLLFQGKWFFDFLCFLMLVRFFVCSSRNSFWCIILSIFVCFGSYHLSLKAFSSILPDIAKYFVPFAIIYLVLWYLYMFCHAMGFVWARILNWENLWLVLRGRSFPPLELGGLRFFVTYCNLIFRGQVEF